MYLHIGKWWGKFSRLHKHLLAGIHIVSVHCKQSDPLPDFPACSEQGSNTCEVTAQVQVKSLIPWVSKVLQLLQNMLELAQDFTDKVTKILTASSILFNAPLCR